MNSKMSFEKGLPTEISPAEMAFITIAMAADHVIAERSFAAKHQSAAF